MQSFAVLALVGAQSAMSQSLTSCGAAGDHLSNLQMSLSPDPIKRKWNRVPQAFTISASGDLDEDITGGTIIVNIAASAFGTSATVAKTVNFTLSDGLIKAGTGISLTVGPVQLPYLPSDAVANGTVKVTNAKGEPVVCVALNLNAPLLEAGRQQKLEEEPAVGNTSVCNQAGDHLQNITATDGADGSSTLTATLDEALTTFTINAGLRVAVLGVGYTVNVPIPVSYAPGFPAGDIRIWGKVLNNTQNHSNANGVISVTGKITATDANDEEIFCVNVGADQTSAGVIVV